MNNELKIVFPIAAVVVIALGAVAYFAIRSAPSTPVVVLATPSTTLTDAGKISRPDQRSRGATNAKVTVVEFGDFQCPACQTAEPIVQELVQKYKDKSVSFAFRNFPLDQHANAQSSATAAEAAGAQGKYWEMHDMLYSKHDEWAETTSAVAENHFIDYAKQVGVKDADKFKAALDNHSYNEILGRDLADAGGLQLQGTPSFFVDEKPVSAVTGVAAAIDAALAK
ncbi:MAG: thioredoxin domain-containing protein [bacterium]